MSNLLDILELADPDRVFNCEDEGVVWFVIDTPGLIADYYGYKLKLEQVGLRMATVYDIALDPFIPDWLWSFWDDDSDCYLWLDAGCDETATLYHILTDDMVHTTMLSEVRKFSFIVGIRDE